MRPARFVPLAAIAMFAIVACSNGGMTPTAMPVPSTEASAITDPSTFTMDGSVQVAPAYVVTLADGRCDSKPVVIDAAGGQLVRVSNDSGVRAGVTNLSEGEWLSDRGCIFRFSVEVKSGSDFYDVEVGTEDAMTISAADARGKGFRMNYGY